MHLSLSLYYKILSIGQTVKKVCTESIYSLTQRIPLFILAHFQFVALWQIIQNPQQYQPDGRARFSLYLLNAIRPDNLFYRH